jgi:hypothetical protein
VKILIGFEKAETAKQFLLPLGSGKNKTDRDRSEKNSNPIVVRLKKISNRKCIRTGYYLRL